MPDADATPTTVSLPDVTMHHRVTGRKDGTPVVFVHGFLVNSTLWDPVAQRLSDAGARCHLVDWPLGAHRLPVPAGTDLSPHGVARMIVQYLEALGLDDVTLVGSDTGGALCQLVLDLDRSRVGRLVLTNCDAFENFPPRFFRPLFEAAKHERLIGPLLAPMRWPAVRHSPLAFGTLMNRPRDARLTDAWLDPARQDPRIRHDIARFARSLDRRALTELAPRLGSFDRPVRIVWGTRDWNFTLATARRLAAAFPDASLVEVPGATTFVSIDHPQAVVDAVLDQ